VDRRALLVLGVSSLLGCCASVPSKRGENFTMDIRLLHEYGRHEALNCASGEIYSVDTDEGQGKSIFLAERAFEDGYYHAEGVVVSGQLGSVGQTAGTLIVRDSRWVEGGVGGCNSKNLKADFLLKGAK